MFETIVLPLDGSPEAEQALDTAAAIAAKFGSKLVLVQAVDSLAQRLAQPPAIMDAPAAAAMNVNLVQEALEGEKAAAGDYLSAARERIAATGRGADAVVGEGAASDVILKVVEDEGAGLIVMTTHGRGGLGRLVFGSVADAVLRHAGVPVLVIRNREKG